MSSPQRRPLRLDRVHDELVELADRVRKTAPEIALGWSALKADLHAAGWPARTPDDDRKPSSQTTDEERRDPVVVEQCEQCGNQFDSIDAWAEHSAASGHWASETVTTGHDTNGADHRDPTGDLAGLDRHYDDLDELQDHLRQVIHAWRAMVDLAQHYRPTTPAVPICSKTACREPVEHTGNGRGFVGMIQIAGVWAARPGQKPTCRRHRRGRQ